MLWVVLNKRRKKKNDTATEVCSLEIFIYLNHYKKVNIEYIHTPEQFPFPLEKKKMLLRMLA